MAMKLVWVSTPLLILTSPMLLHLFIFLYHKSPASSRNHFLLFLMFHALICAILASSTFRPIPDEAFNGPLPPVHVIYEDKNGGCYNDDDDDDEDDDGGGGGYHGSDGYDEDDDDDGSDGEVGWDDEDDDDEDVNDDLEVKAEEFIAKVTSGWKEELLREKLDKQRESFVQ
ncbi:hypothetical protein NMG60_11027243 [Bertholletia excelsa]